MGGIMRHAIVKNGIVVDIQEWRAVDAPIGAVASDTANIGDTFDGSVFIPPVYIPTQAEIDAGAKTTKEKEFRKKVTVDTVDFSLDDDSRALYVEAGLYFQLDNATTIPFFPAIGQTVTLDFTMWKKIVNKMKAKRLAFFAS